MEPDMLSEQELKDLRAKCQPFLSPQSNFEILCGLGIVILGYIIDKALIDKQRHRARGY